MSNEHKHHVAQKQQLSAHFEQAVAAAQKPTDPQEKASVFVRKPKQKSKAIAFVWSYAYQYGWDQFNDMFDVAGLFTRKKLDKQHLLWRCEKDARKRFCHQRPDDKWNARHFIGIVLVRLIGELRDDGTFGRAHEHAIGGGVFRNAVHWQQ